MTNDSNNSTTVGLLFSDTGVTSDIERSQRFGVRLAINEINNSGGVNGFPILMEEHDLGGEPDRFRSYVDKLIKEKNIKLFIGCYMSHTRKAVMSSIERADALLFYPTPYEGFEYSPNIIYGGPSPNQNSAPLAAYLIKNYGNKIVFVGSDYIYPRESHHVMRMLYKQHGGEILDEIYIPLYPSKEEVEYAVKRAVSMEPDVVFSTVVGNGTPEFYSHFAEHYLNKKRPPIASLTTSEAEIRKMTPSVAEGNIVVAPYFTTIKTSKSLWFIEAAKKYFPKDVCITAWAEAAYHQTMMLCESIRKSNSSSAEDIKKELYSFHFEAPQGEIWIEKKNNHTNLTSRIAVINSKGEFDVKWTSPYPIKPDPYVVVHRLDDWSNLMPKVVFP
ncbi:aliphatic amidase expression-regulating protein [Vreelandella aquamarina]|uniref:Amino acid/amide ABC transporter substrate-binding protein, HAAT family n=1 Tax=Vreelandella aquamarina TaxID=77097 RepID=A0A1N6I5T9_9GAMM|nr:transporter substrate-binding domain-containing protein [Halomonas meridiana]GED47497.1 aliphatic amidase expression-regulating protein [Halomonas meridiana]SIN61298.1 amino acid/amide ABC transporter substrate-binding protein, HAAT family [Halomonas meridiana]SIN69754.1 amino acid/amide ABC transporter substrate-binding protein, HAAT family [Halomonas meridiana]SIO27329.1 amino acid/amide ABC transporter substrate-binding protein, HAAT family [Halomonas meridiana]